MTASYDKTARVRRRPKPERWHGVFCSHELWAMAAFGALFVWSILRDRRALAAEPSASPQ